MRFVKIPAILSTVPDLSWLMTILRCVCDVTIPPRIASKTANKLR